VAVSDNSAEKPQSCDVDELIEQALSGESKTPDSLFKAVMKKAEFNPRTYYRHLKKLVNQNFVEELLEKGEDGRIITKYALRRPPLLKEGATDVEDVALSRRLLEVAALLKVEPDGWPPIEAVRKARILGKNFRYIVPSIEPSCEDPDRYVFVWSDDAVNKLRLDGCVSSRFFSLRSVYDSVKIDSSKVVQNDCQVFLGAYGTPEVVGYVDFYTAMRPLRYVGQPYEPDPSEMPQSFSVAVCKEGDVLRVIHVETREGTLDKAWVSGLAKQLKTKKTRAVDHASLKEADKRSALLNLRDVLGQHALSIPSRYVRLVVELLDFSYGQPSSGYVLALALAVEVACTQSGK
jgi:hypothetical protein